MDYIVVNGDMVVFLPLFGAAIVGAPPGEIEGSGPAMLGGEPICIEGDEASVEVANAPYIAAPYLGGMGTLTIEELGGDQLTEKTTIDGTPALLVGDKFKAKFTVNVKGTDPSSGNQDTNSEYSGEGLFISFNFKLQGT